MSLIQMKKKILFVCLGNICRSPAAEAIAQDRIDKSNNLKELLEVDSAGLHSYHEGEPADRRMIQHAKQRGYAVTSISRPVRSQDFDDFDLIVGMDESNVSRLYSLAPTLETSRKIVRMADYFPPETTLDHVPDPYYGGASGFDLVLDLLESSIDNLIQKEVLIK